MDRRAFVRSMGAVVGVVVVPAMARAERIRVLPPADAREEVVRRERREVLSSLLRSVRGGEVASHEGLAVLWLHASASVPALAVQTLDEARGRGALVIEEQARASVPTIVADNRGGSYVLLLAGEIVVGGKQNRIVAEDTLLPPKSGPRDVVVFCVEQGRWAGTSTTFAGRGGLAAPALRSKLAERPSQAHVWAEVNRSVAMAAAPSSTSNYQAVLDKREVQAHQQTVERAIAPKAPAGAQGAAVFAADRLLSIDLFHDASLFARAWPKLLRAHALETYERATATPKEAAVRSRVMSLLDAAASSPGAARGNAGVGTLFELHVAHVHVTALLASEQVVHAAFL
jgi:hypothetical protein